MLYLVFVDALFVACFRLLSVVAVVCCCLSCVNCNLLIVVRFLVLRLSVVSVGVGYLLLVVW